MRPPATLIFLATFLGLVAFVAGVRPGSAASDPNPWRAALADIGLVLVFGLQHSVMARQGFKRMWMRIVPSPVERATYVLAASLALATPIWFWQPLPGTVWRIEGSAGAAVMGAVFAFGGATVLFTTFLIDHFELFGLRQAWAYASGRSMPEPRFKTERLPSRAPSVATRVHHRAFWAAPVMTMDRLAIAALLTVYIVTALVFEERDLIAASATSTGATRNAFRNSCRSYGRASRFAKNA
jgi:methanethiol S-methyltransferase